MTTLILPFFSPSLFCMSALKICVKVSSGTIEASVLKLGVNAPLKFF